MNETTETNTRLFNPDNLCERDQTYKDLIPERLLTALLDYGLKGTPPGSFLMACLQNDLQGAVSNGDGQAIAAIGPIVKFLHNEFPGTAWRNWELVSGWINNADGIRTSALQVLGHPHE